MAKYLLSIVFICLSRLVIAQGCSDAGFCTMGAMKPDQGYNRRIQIKLRSVELTHYVGFTKFGDVIYNYVPEVNIGMNGKTTLQVKLPYVRVDGALATTAGVGDLSLSFTRNIIEKEGYQVNTTIGTKLPTGNSNIKTAEGLSLPMYNQTGLGSYDAIAGISFINSKWLIATGIQKPFGENSNEFLWSDWDGSPLERKANEYTQARALVRGTDVMFRVERNFRFTNFNFSTGLLPIYRLTADVIRLPKLDSEGNFIKYYDHIVTESTGLALTLIISGGYEFNSRLGIKVINGFRLKQRFKNADGLSRELVNNISLVYKF
ncbi:MAG: hypothetical protein RIF36_00210 [Imperialibacter sp.]|uniref:hypothetical protein n=1 Tax=Imperialibacter sp. TaxID=2038411 RepID=UPI0032EBB8DE